MFKNCKLLKISATLIITVFVIGYIALWFYSANNIRKAFDQYSNQEGSSFSYGKLNIEGFPFKLKTKIDDLKFEYELSKANINIAIACDQVIIETNLLFNKLKFTLPTKTGYNVSYSGETYDFYDISQGSYYLELTDKDPINIHNVIASLVKNETYTDFNIAKLHYHADGIKTIDQKTNQEIYNSYADVNITIDSKADLLNDLSVKINSSLEMTDNKDLVPSFMNFIFHKTSINADLKSTFKKGEGSFELPMLNITTLVLGLDSTQVALTGTVQNDPAEQPVVDLKLKLTEWNIFFETLIKQQLISTNQYNLITYLIQDISSQTPPQNSFEVNIKSEKDGAIKFGNIDLNAVSYYIQQIALSQ